MILYYKTHIFPLGHSRPSDHGVAVLPGHGCLHGERDSDFLLFSELHNNNDVVRCSEHKSCLSVLKQSFPSLVTFVLMIPFQVYLPWVNIRLA